MSILFQNPLLLGLLALAAIPPLVHLLSRTRPPSYRFSDTEFLRRIIKTTSRIRKPNDAILLILRTLTILSVALAFTAPILTSKNPILPTTEKTTVFLIDRSASMAARSGVSTRMESACREASAFLNAYQPTQANIIWMASKPIPAYPTPGNNLDFLQQELTNAKPLPEACDLTAACDLALQQFNNTSQRCDVVIISDFQASAWKDFHYQFPDSINVRCQSVATDTPSNIAITHCSTTPSSPVIGQVSSTMVTVNNFSKDPISTTVTLTAGPFLQSQPTTITPWGESQLIFKIPNPNPGVFPISVALAADTSDALPLDNTYFDTITVRDKLTLSLGPNPSTPESTLLIKLANAIPWLQTTSSPTGDFSFIPAWTGEQPETLLNHAKLGGILLLQPAHLCPLASVYALCGDHQSPPSTLAQESNPSGWTILPNENHPSLALFRSGTYGNPFLGLFHERIKLPANSLPATASVIASYQDGVPAIVSIPTQGAPILLWNISLNPSKTTWPSQANFLPAIAEILLQQQESFHAPTIPSLPGSLVSMTSNDPSHVNAISLLDPSQKSVSISQSVTEKEIRWTAESPAIPGIYRWQVSANDIAFSPVNLPESESNLQSLLSIPSLSNQSTISDSITRQAAIDHGIPLWPWLCALALIFILTESFFSLRTLTRSRSSL